MNVPVKVELKSFPGKPVEVLDDQLHSLIHDGQVTYKQAVEALQAAKLELDKRFYPWLQDIEELKDGSLNVDKPVKPEPKPEIVAVPASISGDAVVGESISGDSISGDADVHAPDANADSHEEADKDK